MGWWKGQRILWGGGVFTTVDMGTTVATLINELYSLKCAQLSDSELPQDQTIVDTMFA